MSTRATRAAVGGDRRALHLPSMDPQAERLGLAQSLGSLGDGAIDVIEVDVQASDGVIHVINGVLQPPPAP